MAVDLQQVMDVDVESIGLSGMQNVELVETHLYEVANSTPTGWLSNMFAGWFSGPFEGTIEWVASFFGHGAKETAVEMIGDAKKGISEKALSLVFGDALDENFASLKTDWGESLLADSPEAAMNHALYTRFSDIDQLTAEHEALYSDLPETLQPDSAIMAQLTSAAVRDATMGQTGLWSTLLKKATSWWSGEDKAADTSVDMAQAIQKQIYQKHLAYHLKQYEAAGIPEEKAAQLATGLAHRASGVSISSEGELVVDKENGMSHATLTMTQHAQNTTAQEGSRLAELTLFPQQQAPGTVAQQSTDEPATQPDQINQLIEQNKRLINAMEHMQGMPPEEVTEATLASTPRKSTEAEIPSRP